MLHIEKIDKRLVAYVDIFLLANRLQAVMDKGMKLLTAKQWLTLTILLNFEEAPTLKQVAEQMGISHQSVRKVVGQLEKKDFVKVVPDADDGRAIRIMRTEKAETIRKRDTKRNWEFVFELFSALTDEEVEVFYNAQKKLYDKLKNMEEWDNE